jgi:hypothetical protein
MNSSDATQQNGNEYEVLVTRTSYSSLHIKVTARSADEAQKRALEQAGNFSYSEHDADYDAESVREIVAVGKG